MIKRGSFMKNFYDLQQFLKTFGIIIYMKDRKHTLSMVEYEVRELRRIELISKEEFLRAMLIIKQEFNYELSKG
jgi:putative cytoplasmic protein